MQRLIALLIVGVCPIAASADEQGPAKDTPELQVLSNYIGTWDVKITSRSIGLAQGQTTAKWILDGRFVQQSSFLTAPDGRKVLKLTTLMTYDRDTKTYRTWSFISNGTTITAEGTWDAAARTMTSIRRADGNVTTTTANFADHGVEKWTITTTNQNKQVIGQAISGTNTLRKD